MATLTKQIRADIQESVLSAAFKSRFDNIEKELTVLLRAKLEAEHPIFMNMLADPSMAEYVARSSQDSHSFDTGDSRELFMVPTSYANVRDYTPCHSRYHCIDTQRTVRGEFVAVPASGFLCNIDAQALYKQYRRVWQDLEEAATILRTTLAAFKTVEKLKAEFPELAKYAPAVVVKANLPLVIPADVRKALKDVGVPAAAQS